MWNCIKELFLLSAYSMIYANVAGIKDPLKQDLALEFCLNQYQVISILNESHINHDESQTKDCLLCFIKVLKVSLRLTLIQKRGSCPLRLLLLMETLFYNSATFFRAYYTVLLVPCVNTLPYSHRFKSLMYTRTSPNLYHLLIYSSDLLVQFHCLVLI